jgi:mono/diheme cytochrome c family protein
MNVTSKNVAARNVAAKNVTAKNVTAKNGTAMNVTAMNVIPSAARNLLFAAGLLFASTALAAGSAEKGKAAFVRHGCWQCHGYLGQGGIAGKKLAPNPLPLETMSAFVRNSAGAMPPYQKAILSDADLADIHAYLSSLPKAPDYKGIPLLNP